LEKVARAHAADTLQISKLAIVDAFAESRFDNDARNFIRRRALAGTRVAGRSCSIVNTSSLLTVHER